MVSFVEFNSCGIGRNIYGDKWMIIMIFNAGPMKITVSLNIILVIELSALI